MTTTPTNTPPFRIGIGFDAHALAAGRRLVLGGVDIPFDQGLVGHSDGDALLHAIMDALLGAANLGDKGQHFPSADERYRDIASRRLLAQVGQLLAAQGWQIGNIDATMVAQQPRLGPFIPQMREKAAAALAIDPERVSVKVTTTDYLGFTGRAEGIAAVAVALLFRQES